MTTHANLRRYVYLFVSLLLLGNLATACKSTAGKDEVDPREQYVGIYDGGYQSQKGFNSFTGNPETGTVSINVSKAQDAKQIYLELMFNGGANKQTMTAELTGNTFKVIDKQKESFTFEGQAYDADYTAEGQFNDKVMTINTKTEARLSSDLVYTQKGSISVTKK